MPARLRLPFMGQRGGVFKGGASRVMSEGGVRGCCTKPTNYALTHTHTHTHGGRQLRRYLSYVRVCAKESAAPLCNAPAPLELYSFFRPSRTRHLQLATLCQDSVLSARLTSSYSIWARCRVNLARNIWQDDAMPQPLRPFAPLTMHRKKILDIS